MRRRHQSRDRLGDAPNAEFALMIHRVAGMLAAHRSGGSGGRAECQTHQPGGGRRLSRRRRLAMVRGSNESRNAIAREINRETATAEGRQHAPAL
jgi:hypothetical protein